MSHDKIPTTAADGRPTASTTLIGCHHCGAIQQLPPLGGDEIPLCYHCHTALRHNPAAADAAALHPAPAGVRWRQHLAAALSLAALLLYPPAMLLPMMTVAKLGHSHRDSLLSGTLTLLNNGDIVVGLVVLFCSILLPLLKLTVLLLLALEALRHRRHRAGLFRLVDRIGRWGMLDVMLVAVLVAFVKLKEVITIHIEAGLIAFTAVVLLSLAASIALHGALAWQVITTAPHPPAGE